VICSGAERVAEPDLLVHPIGMRIVPDMCIVDGAEARIGDLGLLLSSEPALQLRGAAAIAPLVTTIQQNINYDGGGWWIRRQLQVGLRDESPDAPGEAVRVARRVEELCTLIGQYLDRNAPEPSVGDDLWKRAEELDFEMQSAMEHAGVTLFPVPEADQRETLREALELVADSPRPGRIDLFLHDAPPNLHASSLLPRFERANAAGAEVRLVAVVDGKEPAKAEETISAVRLLCEQINSKLLTFSISRAPFPSALILDGRIVVIGGDSWFRRSERANCCFVVESPQLAAELRAAVEQSIH
jgi:hypothetical protein